MVSILLTGCSFSDQPEPTVAGIEFQGKTKAMDEVEQMKQCQAELEVLKSIGSTQYVLIKAEFDKLMAGAAQYSGIRTHINDTTQYTVDSLYRYRVNLLCAKINQAVLNQLADRGETIKWAKIQSADGAY